MIGMTLFTGTVVGLQGYAALNQIGASAFTGFVSAYFNTREIAPLVAGLALSATVGAGFTAQLGSMRINEEVDALEGMGVPSLPYLVTTRIVAGAIAVIPLYAIGLVSSYFGSRLVTVYFEGQSAGTYDHYFGLFLSPVDVLWSFLKVLIFSVVVILVHCYYGYRASGGPAGVGVAVGRGGTHRHRHDQHHRLPHEPGHLGRDDDRAGRGMSSAPGLVKVRRRLAGTAFLVVLALLAWLSVLIYQKKFSPAVMVTLYTSSAGNEMHPGAQVMARGVQVGEVRQISADGNGARLELAIQPAALPLLPANVSAEMLPTTLFGERYVALILPASPSHAALANGSVISENRSGGRAGAGAGAEQPAAVAGGGPAGQAVAHPDGDRRRAARPR